MRKLSSSLYLAIIFSLLILPSATSASGGSGGAVAPTRPSFNDGFVITKTIRATMLKLDTEKRILYVKDEKDRELKFPFNKEIRVRAEDAKNFGGRKNLTFEDLTPNANIKVIYEEEERTVVEIKILKKS